MKALQKLAALVAALALFTLMAACGTDPVGSHSDSTMAIDGGDAGPTGDIAGSDNGTDGSKADADAGSQSDNDSGSSTDADVNPDSTTDKDVAVDGDQQDSTTDASAPACPKAGDAPDATLEIKLADGPQCFVPGSDVAKMAQQIMGAKLGIGGYKNSNMEPAAPPNPNGTGGCSTIHMPDFCFPFATVYGKKYAPTWSDQMGPYAGSILFLAMQYPEFTADPTYITDVALTKCANGLCMMESPISNKQKQFKATYDTNSKKLSWTLISKGDVQFVDEYSFE